MLAASSRSCAPLMRSVICSMLVALAIGAVTLADLKAWHARTCCSSRTVKFPIFLSAVL